MAVDERSRHELYERLVQALGTEAAVTMMEHLPPVGWADVATKHDVHQLEQRLDLRLQTLEHKLLSAFRGEIAAALTSQTRIIIFTMAGLVVTIGGFAVAIARVA